MSPMNLDEIEESAEEIVELARALGTAERNEHPTAGALKAALLAEINRLKEMAQA